MNFKTLNVYFKLVHSTQSIIRLCLKKKISKGFFFWWSCYDTLSMYIVQKKVIDEINQNLITYTILILDYLKGLSEVPLYQMIKNISALFWKIFLTGK